MVTPLFCVLLGFAVALLRPWDPLAWLVLVLLLGFANFIDFVPTQQAWGSLVRVPTLAYRAFFGASWPLSLLLLGLYFPTGSASTVVVPG